MYRAFCRNGSAGQSSCTSVAFYFFDIKYDVEIPITLFSTLM